jgi:uncharacterized membrane protein
MEHFLPLTLKADGGISAMAGSLAGVNADAHPIISVPRLVMFALVGLLIVGFWLRVRHVSDLGLISDEGVEAQAVQRILEHGVPIFASGLLYTRALPFLYAQAGTAKLFGLDEFSLRLPAVLFGTVTIWAAFLLGNMLYGYRVGLLTAAMMTFSVWEIEMSRYARFYTAFQFTYLVSLLCFYRGYIGGESAYKVWFVVGAFLSIVMHDLGAMLATSFLAILPSTLYPLRRKVMLALSAVGMGALSLLYFVNVRAVLPAVSSSLPETDGPGFTSAPLARVHKLVETILLQLPDVTLLSYVGSEHRPVFVMLLVVALSATACILYYSGRNRESWRGGCAILIVWAAFIYQIGLVLLLLIAYSFAFAEGWRRRSNRGLRIACGAGAACLLFWSLVPVIDPAVSARRVAWAMFSYPNFYDQFLKWYVWGWPFLSVVAAIGIVQLAARFMTNLRDPKPLFIVGAIFVPAVATSFFKPNDDAARYTFHLYPLILVIFASVAAQAISYCVHGLPPLGRFPRAVVAGVLGVAALMFSQDANPVHAWSVGDWTYQSPRHPIRSIVVGSNSRTHPDYKNPSLYVKERLRSGDRVMVAGGPVAAAICHHYIGQVDYTVSNRASVEMLDRDGGKLTDKYIGSEIITAVFMITDRTIVSLESDGIPSSLLTRLRELRDREFQGEPIFLEAVKNTLGVQQAVEYKAPILRASVVDDASHCCRIEQIVRNHSQGDIWLVGNWSSLMKPDRDYSDSSKEYLHAVIQRPDYWGLDGQTFAVKIRRPGIAQRDSLAVTP